MPHKKKGAKEAGGIDPATARKGFQESVDKLLSDQRYSATSVFERIKEAMGATSDAELAWWLGVSPQNIWNKKRRNSVPYREAIFIAGFSNTSLSYILTGEADPHSDRGPHVPRYDAD